MSATEKRPTAASPSTSTSASNALAPGSARTPEPPSPRVTYALLACFLSPWSPGASNNADAQKAVSPPSNHAFDFFLRICFTLDMMQKRLAGRFSQEAEGESQPTMQVSKTKSQNDQEEIVLYVERYSLELHVARHGDQVKTPWLLVGVVIYNEDELIATGHYPCFPLVLEIASHSKSSESTKTLIIDTDTKAMSFVEHLGEPKNKGGGELSHSGPGVWMQWELDVKLAPGASSEMRKMVLHITLKGEGSRGQDRWEKGNASECTWNDLFLQHVDS